MKRKTNLRGDVLLAVNQDHQELDTLSAVERATEGDHLQCQNQGRFTTSLLAVNPVCAYHVIGSIYGVDVCFMLDTGAAVSLLRKNVWDNVLKNLAFGRRQLLI